MVASLRPFHSKFRSTSVLLFAKLTRLIVKHNLRKLKKTCCTEIRSFHSPSLLAGSLRFAQQRIRRRENRCGGKVFLRGNFHAQEYQRETSPCSHRKDFLFRPLYRCKHRISTATVGRTGLQRIYDLIEKQIILDILRETDRVFVERFSSVLEQCRKM